MLWFSEVPGSHLPISAPRVASLSPHVPTHPLQVLPGIPQPNQPHALESWSQALFLGTPNSPGAPSSSFEPDLQPGRERSGQMPPWGRGEHTCATSKSQSGHLTGTG